MRTRSSRARTRGRLFSRLPDDVQRECLARVPFADLCRGVVATCKTWKNLVTSKAYRETRASAGWAEYAVFMSQWEKNSQCFLVTASGAHRTAPRPVVNNSLTRTLWDEVIIMDIDSRDERMFVYDPRENEWSELSQLVRWPDDQSAGDVIEGAAVVASESAGKLFVVGGLETAFSDSRRRVDAYDPATDEWSRLPDQPRPAEWAGGVEVDGKLYFYGNELDPASIAILDAASHTWETAPPLPYVPDDDDDLHTHITGFAREGCLVVMARFRLGSTDESIKYAAFVFDPSAGAWSEAPFPCAPVQAYRCTHIDGTLFALGSEWPDLRGFQNPNTRFGGANTRVVMLRPGSTTWVDLPVPEAMKDVGTRISAVHIA